jgi:hypothetical protein
MRLGIIETQTESLHVARRTVDFKFHQIGAAVPNLANHRLSVVFHPSRRSRERMQKPPEMSSPGADFEIEIVLKVRWRLTWLGWLA